MMYHYPPPTGYSFDYRLPAPPSEYIQYEPQKTYYDRPAPRRTKHTRVASYDPYSSPYYSPRYSSYPSPYYSPRSGQYTSPSSTYFSPYSSPPPRQYSNQYYNPLSPSSKRAHRKPRMNTPNDVCISPSATHEFALPWLLARTSLRFFLHC